MIGQNVSIPAITALSRRHYVPVGAAVGLATLALSFLPIADSFLARTLLFYAATSLAYVLMPFARRGDVPLVSAWVVLFSELSPCITGELMSPTNVTADALGVLMAVGPIYIARFRQVQQGDTRPAGRRASER